MSAGNAPVKTQSEYSSGTQNILAKTSGVAMIWCEYRGTKTKRK